jgi:hypothetical protein
MRRRLTALSWGYWGWGQATRELDARFTAVEASMGFKPPLFVDVRASRSVRASGFYGDAFERVVGPRRYRWFRRLGNAAIVSGKGPMRLIEPKAVGELLALVKQASQDSRRVVFFCSCEAPWFAAQCHRRLVATTLLRAARSGGVPLSIQEWPGGIPTARVVTTFRVSDGTIAALSAGKSDWVSLGRYRPRPRELGLPTGSLVRLTEDDRSLTVATCPPRLSRGKWKLQLLVEAGGSRSLSGLAARVRAVRRELGLEARRT